MNEPKPLDEMLSDPATREPRLTALVEMMVLAGSSDGEFSAVEREKLEASIVSLLGDRADAQKLPALVAAVEKRIAAEGREARLSAVKAALPDAAHRKAALGLAIEVMAADGIVRTSERELILETADALDIDRDTAADIVAARVR
jgi:uncharacterized tellurite resistance protein B-like protein